MSRIFCLNFAYSSSVASTVFFTPVNAVSNSFPTATDATVAAATAAPATPAPIHLEPTEHPKGGDHFDELEQMLDKKHLPDQPQKPTVVVTTPKKRGLFSQVLGLFKKRK